jgi:hypothetical protein
VIQFITISVVICITTVGIVATWYWCWMLLLLLLLWPGPWLNAATDAADAVLEARLLLLLLLLLLLHKRPALCARAEGLRASGATGFSWPRAGSRVDRVPAVAGPAAGCRCVLSLVSIIP